MILNSVSECMFFRKEKFDLKNTVIILLSHVFRQEKNCIFPGNIYDANYLICEYYIHVDVMYIVELLFYNHYTLNNAKY